MSRGRRTPSSRILISIRGHMAIAYCSGTLDRIAVEDLLDRVRGLAAQGVRGFVCSLERVSHVHFHAIEPLLRLQKMVAAEGGRIVCTDASPYVRQILDFGGVPRHLAVLEHMDDAVWSLRHADATLAAQPTAS
jgi:hypothetical protein